MHSLSKLNKDKIEEIRPAGGTHRGYPMDMVIYKDRGQRLDLMVYSDGYEEAEGENRPCPICGSTEDIDGCLGKLPGVRNACCGHGDRSSSYIQFENGVIIRDFIIESYESANGFSNVPDEDDTNKTEESNHNEADQIHDSGEYTHERILEGVEDETK